MPKSIEHYQQETGRAGRDGKPADCVLFHSGQDFQLWRVIIENNETTDLDSKMKMLSEMYGFATSARCRHRRLVEYFGQPWSRGSCEACDFCTGAIVPMAESSDLAKRLLAGVVRTGQRYGMAYIVEVLAGEETERVTQRSHASLDVFGSMSGTPKPVLFAWLRQLIDQDVLRPEGEYGVLKITPHGFQVLEGRAQAAVYEGPTPKKSKRSKRVAKSEEVERPSDSTP